MPPVLFSGGRIFTSDPSSPFAESLVVDGERIAFVGTLAAARERAGPGARHVDLKGGVAMPGFVDGHAHILGMGGSLLMAQLRGLGSLEDILAVLGKWHAENQDEERVLGLGWLYTAVPGGKPTRQMLDGLFPDKPVYLLASDLHSSWLNSKALEEVGITRETKDPVGGCVVRDENGDATGHLVETAHFESTFPIINGGAAELRAKRFAAAMKAYNSTGVTAAVEMALEKPALETMLRAEKEGKQTLRVVAHCIIHRRDTPEEELAQVAEAARFAKETEGSDMFRVAGIKLVTDGVIDACTATLIEPYANGSNAEPIWDRESLERVVLAADSAGIQIALHAIGDQAVRNAVDALERAQKENGTSGRRHRIEHLEYTDEAEVARLAPLGITASMQPVHCNPAYLSNWIEQLGQPRAARGFAWREFLDAGATLAFGTDTPTAPHMPLPNIYIAATRKHPDDPTIPPLGPHHALPVDEAVVHATKDSAWASHMDGKVGMLKEGLLADVVVLNGDPFAEGAAPEQLLKTRVVMTMLGGKEVFRADE
ncbi:amidohydrolase family protein [Hyaloraphidium curvatum]|nr:amidohydrolase family protein [Hyaloraphidium curvatum]